MNDWIRMTGVILASVWVMAGIVAFAFGVCESRDAHRVKYCLFGAFVAWVNVWLIMTLLIVIRDAKL